MNTKRAAIVAMLILCSSAPSLGSHVETLDEKILDAHNSERLAFGVAAMAWDVDLAEAADEYAAELAETDRWAHARPDQRVGQGENLWKGTRDRFEPEAMVARWAAGKVNFQPGTFPNVSRSGKWEDVAHYTQVVWPASRRVGCSLRSSERYDYLVCRYSQPGNAVGQRVGPSRLAGLWRFLGVHPRG
jgi:hypothetical protein